MRDRRSGYRLGHPMLVVNQGDVGEHGFTGSHKTKPLIEMLITGGVYRRVQCPDGRRKRPLDESHRLSADAFVVVGRIDGEDAEMEMPRTLIYDSHPSDDLAIQQDLVALAAGNRGKSLFHRVVAGRAADLDPWIDASVIVERRDLHLDQVLGIDGSRQLEIDVHRRSARKIVTGSAMPFSSKLPISIRR